MKEKLNPLEKAITLQSFPEDNHDPIRARSRTCSNSKKNLPPLPATALKTAGNREDTINAPVNISRQKSESLSSKSKVVLAQLPKDNSKLAITDDDTIDAKLELKKLILTPHTISINNPAEKEKEISSELKKINIKQLIDTMKPLIESRVTPLILDQSGRCDIFFQYSTYSGLFVEAKKILVETLILKKITMQVTLDNLRKMLVSCLKYGRTLVIRMTDSACDFMTTFTHPDFFPASDLLVEAGQRFKSEEYWRKVVRDEDLERDGQFNVKDEFCVIILSTLSAHEYKNSLENAIPISGCAAIFIEPPSEQAQPAFGI